MLFTSLLVITILFSVGYGVLMLGYTWGWQRLRNFNVSTDYIPTTNISVILPVRNEGNNIERCLKSILNQQYPKDLYEVIVVDDHSSDNTLQKINTFSASQLQVYSLKKERAPKMKGKKSALSWGIGKAKGSLIVTTDGDCHVPSTWLRSIAEYYENFAPKFIAAPVTYAPVTNFFSKFQKMDFLGMIGIGGGSIGLNHPQVCNGANVAYERSTFYKVAGFKNISKTASGDDMLLMQKVHHYFPGEVHCLKSRSAIVQTPPQKGIFSFINQRIRWGAKGKKLFDKKVSYILLFVFIFNLFIIILAVIACFISKFLTNLLIILSTKFVMDFVFYGFVLYFFREIKLLWLFLPSQLLHIPYIILVGSLANFRTYNWKGRKVHY